MPKQTTSGIADPLSIKSTSPLRYIAMVSSLPLCSNLQSEKLLPLPTQLDTWESIPGTSSWVLQTIERGSLLQGCGPDFFQDNAHVLRSEHKCLLVKEAVKTVLPENSEEGFYSSNSFLVRKKDGGLRPILNLRLLSLKQICV